MNINEIITEAEYTRERSAKELFEYVTQKDKELREWSPPERSRKIRYQELGKGLPNKFTHELTPLAYYAKAYYGHNPIARFKPCCGSEQYDGIIIDNDENVLVEFTDAIDGKKWGLQKEFLINLQPAPWEYNILGVKDNKTKRTRTVSDIIITEDSPPHSVIINKIKTSVQAAISEKCKKSLKGTLPYGRNTTILIGTFDDTVIRPSIHKNDWDDFVAFKQVEIDSMKHNFSKIILFGWLDKKFIE
jgi:hypothetical protein